MSGDVHATDVVPEPEQARNMALSVWSNACNAHCSEEDRVHEPECVLAARLYVLLEKRDRPRKPPAATEAEIHAAQERGAQARASTATTIAGQEMTRG